MRNFLAVLNFVFFNLKLLPQKHSGNPRLRGRKNLSYTHSRSKGSYDGKEFWPREKVFAPRNSKVYCEVNKLFPWGKNGRY